MQLEFFGAAGEVTGSCHILTVGNRKVLLDCGMIQGGRRAEERNREPFPFNARHIDAVLLSHAHIDHSGRLPLLTRRGFTGTIHTQNASRDIAKVLLADSALIAASSNRRTNRYRERRGEPPVEPLYSLADAAEAIEQFEGHLYSRWFDVVAGVRARFHDAGHILGSAVVEVCVREGETERTVVFSGDLGQYDSPLLHDPATMSDVMRKADVLLMESTYGDRSHRGRAQTLTQMGELLRSARGNIVIPAFAVGRSQELLYHFGKFYDEWEMDRWQVFLDSPLAIRTTNIYWNYPHLYDEEATLLRKEQNPMPSLPNLKLSRSADDSKAIAHIKSGAIIIAGSGMCNGGRVLHHFKRELERDDAHVLFTGYQPPGNLGRRIIDGNDQVRIHGEEIDVRAEAVTVGGMSAHGDADDLLRWYRSFENKPHVFLVHGDKEAGQALKGRLVNEGGARAELAETGRVFDLEQMR